MNCEDIGALLPDYIDGRLTEEETKRVEEHTASCPDCGKELEALREIFLPDEALDDIQPSLRMTDDFYKMLEQEKVLAKEERLVVPLYKKYTRYAASIVLVLLGFGISEALRHEWHDEAHISATYILDINSPSAQLDAIYDLEAQALNDQHTLEALMITMTQAEHPNVRLAALEGIARHYDTPTVRRFITRALESEPDETIQLQLIQTLVKWKDVQAVESIRRFYAKESTSEEMKKMAKAGIHHLHGS
ncbi:hypothetical protein FUAX_29860 [Fulvitalea axinellae]|uniref:Putative zinc-finger domain-containing protein n=1 Tax=Fulvitalea axinellae TaxID=1182444 RepID=A0AAU9CVN3_9BACT|nr:hypothetical protein FUAX_29860 [Fulvitalea axinellae]